MGRVAKQEDGLLEQIRQVPREEYETHRCRIQELEAPRQHRHRLHRNSVEAMQQLINRPTTRRAASACKNGRSHPSIIVRQTGVLPAIVEHLEYLDQKAIPTSRSKRAWAALQPEIYLRQRLDNKWQRKRQK